MDSRETRSRSASHIMQLLALRKTVLAPASRLSRMRSTSRARWNLITYSRSCSTSMTPLRSRESVRGSRPRFAMREQYMGLSFTRRGSMFQFTQTVGCRRRILYLPRISPMLRGRSRGELLARHPRCRLRTALCVISEKSDRKSVQ